MSAAQTVTGQKNVDRALDRLNRLIRQLKDAKVEKIQLLNASPRDERAIRVANENLDTIQGKFKREADLLGSFVLTEAEAKEEDVDRVKNAFEDLFLEVSEVAELDGQGNLIIDDTLLVKMETARNTLRETIIDINEREVLVEGPTTDEDARILEDLFGERVNLIADIGQLEEERLLGDTGLRILAEKRAQLERVEAAIKEIQEDTPIPEPAPAEPSIGDTEQMLADLEKRLADQSLSGTDIVGAANDFHEKARGSKATVSEGETLSPLVIAVSDAQDAFKREGTDAFAEALQSAIDALIQTLRNIVAPAWAQQLQRVLDGIPEDLNKAKAEQSIRDLWNRALRLGVTDEDVNNAIALRFTTGQAPPTIDQIDTNQLIGAVDDAANEREPLPEPTPEPGVPEAPTGPTPVPVEPIDFTNFLQMQLSIAESDLKLFNLETRSAIDKKDRERGVDMFDRLSRRLLELSGFIINNRFEIEEAGLLKQFIDRIQKTRENVLIFVDELPELPAIMPGIVCISETVNVGGVEKTFQFCAKPGIGLPDFDQAQFAKDVKKFQKMIEETTSKIPRDGDEPAEPGEPGDDRPPLRPPLAPAGRGIA